MRKIISFPNFMIAAAALAIALLSYSSVRAEDAPELKCPVSGHPASKEHMAEHNGGKVYFCCDNCPKAFAANMKKFAAKANAQMVQDGQFKQVKCPLQGKPVNPAAVVEVAGVKVAFCCNGCKSAVAKAKPAQQIRMVFNDKAFQKGFEKVAADEKK
jgi:YHS domain-containing protein